MTIVHCPVGYPNCPTRTFEWAGVFERENNISKTTCASWKPFKLIIGFMRRLLRSLRLLIAFNSRKGNYFIERKKEMILHPLDSIFACACACARVCLCMGQCVFCLTELLNFYNISLAAHQR